MKKYFQIRGDASYSYDWEFLNEIAKNEDEKIGAEWQQECLEQIKDCNMVILSAPTGSGKTNVFLYNRKFIQCFETQIKNYVNTNRLKQKLHLTLCKLFK